MIDNHEYWKQLAAQGCAVREETTDSNLSDTFEEDGKYYHYKTTIDADKMLVMLELEKSRNIKRIATIVTINFVASIILAILGFLF